MLTREQQSHGHTLGIIVEHNVEAARRDGTILRANGFRPDAASYGYNGYSFLLTGRDRFGETLPLFTDNFGDLIATATVYVLYLLGSAVAGRGTGLLAALLLASSPWHVQISRYAERSPLLALCFCLGLLFLWRWREHGGRDLVWSALCFGLCFYTYAAARVFAPLFVAGVVLLYHRELRPWLGSATTCRISVRGICFLTVIQNCGTARAAWGNSTTSNWRRRRWARICCGGAGGARTR